MLHQFFFYIRVISNGKWFWQINSHILKKYERPCKYLARWPVKANLLPESWLNTYDFGVLHWSPNRVTRRTDDYFPSDLATYVSTENSVASASLPSPSHPSWAFCFRRLTELVASQCSRNCWRSLLSPRLLNQSQTFSFKILLLESTIKTSNHSENN